MATHADSDSRRRFEAAVLAERASLYASALQLCRAEDEARDLVQEALVRAWRFWSGYREDGHCGAWLRRILRNTFINRYRRRKREERAMGRLRECLPDAASLSPRAAVEGDFGDEVTRALQQLPAEFRRVLLAVDRDDLSYREVAARLQCPVGTVMSRLHRGRRLLRQQLAEYGQQHGYLRAG